MNSPLTASAWVASYLDRQCAVLSRLPVTELTALFEMVKQLHEAGGTLFLAGNGGNAASAAHFATDLGKGASDLCQNRFRVVSLADNTAWLTALGNDYSYDDVFVRQLMNFARPGDLLLVSSVSGNSPNLVAAVKWAREHGLGAVALVGAKQGQLAALAQHVITVPDTHYGRVEDVQMTILHLLAYAFIEPAAGFMATPFKSKTHHRTMNKPSDNSSQPAVKTTRRRFLQTTALAATAFTIVPRHVLGGPGNTSPNEKLNIAGIGVGGMGAHNLQQCAGENIVALCDIDESYAAKTFQAYPKARVYRDFREMLDKQKDIDAVIIATPDHSHAVIGLTAIRAGKHVYIQKPLAHSVEEARLLTNAAREHKIVSQMGNQGRSGAGTRQMCEWMWGGAIGTVREIHAWTNRPVWPQGVEVERPKETPPVPAGLDWDRWLGPVAFRPYHPAYVPGTWRAWWDFGTGSLGDLGCHILDAPFWAMKFKYPESVEGCISTYWKGLWDKTDPKMENYPRSTIVRFQFPARGDMPACKLTWWDGGLMPPRPDGIDPEEKLGDEDGGVIYIGDKGVMISGCYGRKPRIYPEERQAFADKIAQSIPRVPGDIDGHEKDWVRACKGGSPASSNFDCSGPLSEMVLMGNLAVRYPNRKLLWDGEKMEVTNDKEANSYVRRKYRPGWSLT